MTITDLTNRCYVPYSNKASAAIVESKKGEFFPGVRVENVSFPLTVSAVQNALFCCISEGQEPAVLYVNDRSGDEEIAFWEKTYSLQIKAINNKSEYFFPPVITYPVQSIQATLHSLLRRAVVDESNFPVSTLLHTDIGLISGINIELRPWDRGLCAERTALAKAISYGATSYKALYICTEKGEYCSPCGACRQVIVEHLPHNPVHLFQPDGTQTVLFSSDLLPNSFQFSLH